MEVESCMWAAAQECMAVMFHVDDPAGPAPLGSDSRRLDAVKADVKKLLSCEAARSVDRTAGGAAVPCLWARTMLWHCRILFEALLCSLSAG